MKFATAINCMDGRTQLPLIEFLKNKYGVDYVDMITEPGPIKILSEGKDELILESVRRRVDISITKHGSEIIAIAGHYDCAGNPSNKETQIRQIIDSIKEIKSWYPNVQIIGLWIDQNWQVETINIRR